MLAVLSLSICLTSINCNQTFNMFGRGKSIFGCLDGNCENGKGTKTWESGNKYVGEFKDGKMHGQGTYIGTA